jgi:hypothetical protein
MSRDDNQACNSPGWLGACMFGLTENQTGDPGLIVADGASRRLSPGSASHCPLPAVPVQDLIEQLAGPGGREGPAMAPA